MTITATINGKNYYVMNTVDFSERLDEEMDSGSIQIKKTEKDPFPDYTLVKLILSDGESERSFDFYSFDNVEQRRSDYYVHTLELVELSRLLMGTMIDGRAVTQPLEDSGEPKKTLKEVVTELLKTARLIKYDVENKMPIGSKFFLDPNQWAFLETVVSPEFHWSGGTLLWECLCDVGNVINCVPRLLIGNEGKLYVTFDKINDITGEYEI